MKDKSQWWCERDGTEDPIFMPPPPPEWSNGSKIGKPIDGRHHDTNSCDNGVVSSITEARETRVEAGELQCECLPAIGAGNIPPRPWAYGRFLLFGSAAVIGAVDGAGKGVLAVVMAIAQITGKALLGEKVWRTGPVALVSYEDDEDEWHRRFAAACCKYEVAYAHVMANVYFIRRPGARVVFAQREKTGDISFPDGDAILGQLKRIRAVLLIIDPFNSAHTMDDGNNNVLIARVANELSRIARAAVVAVLVLHHLRKGSTGDLDDLMGATSLRANFRSCRILMRMTPDEAKGLNINDRWRYLRIAGSKANYAPPEGQKTWYELCAVNLGNGAGIYPEGDEVAVACPWTPPSAFDGITLPTIERIFTALRGEVDGKPGRFYSPKPNSVDWAGHLITGLTGKTRKEAGTILTTWAANGVLSKDSYWWKGNRASRIVLNAAKAGEMLAPLRSRSEGGE